MKDSRTQQRGFRWRLPMLAGLAAMACLTRGSGRAQNAQQPDYVYIADTSDPFTDDGRIILLDAAQGKVIRTFPAGGDPDFVLSPDGSRLYADGFLISADGRRSPWLSIYETSSGRLLQRISNQGALQHTLPVYAPGMDMSPSGRWLYMSKIGAEGDGGYYFYLTALDTVRGEFLPNQVRYPCRASVQLASHEDLNVVIACWDSPFIFDVSLGATTEPARRLPIKPSIQAGEISANDPATSIAPRRQTESWGTVFLRPDGRVVMISNAQGSIFLVDRAAGVGTKIGQNVRLRGTPGLYRAIVSRDEDAVYFIGEGVAHLGGGSFSHSTRILRADPITLSPKGTLTTSKPFFSMALSQDGRRLFTIDPDSATVTVIDTATMTEVKQISVGKRPIFGAAAP
jgi:YVTN family beta-propeller protein